MKPPWEWAEEDLLDLIRQPVEESLTLDYKRCAALEKTSEKRTELTKDVSAFANSAGGTLVYGIIESGQTPTALDAGYDPKVITREWVEQVINAIQPRIDGVRIKPVDLQRSAPGRVAYVVSVPQSMRTPHQAADKRYYKRFNFQSVPMEDYEVRDSARRQQAPDLYVDVSLPNGEPQILTLEDATGAVSPIEVGWHIRNESMQPAEFAYINLFVDARFGIVSAIPCFSQDDRQVYLDEGRPLPVRCYTHVWHVAQRVPLFKGPPQRLAHNPFRVAVPVANVGEASFAHFLLGWEAYGPGMFARSKYRILVVAGRRAFFAANEHEFFSTGT